MSNEEIKRLTQKLTESFADQGKLIEGGWQGFRLYMLPKDAPENQVLSMRLAFFGGAQHLFATIMNILEPGTEATEKDLDRMTLIHRELEEFYKEMTRRGQ